MTRLRDVRVDDSGIFARSRREVVVDVLFDDRRVFSFWLRRDSQPVEGGHLFAWPRAIRSHLDGHTEMTMVEPATGDELYRGEVRLGKGDDRIAVVNRDGAPLALDKSMRKVLTFDTRSADHVEPLLDAIADVLATLKEAGVDAFLAYGTLLGRRARQHLIGHDSDADLGYVSKHEYPVDVIRESFQLHRFLVEAGYHVTRYSAAAFKVDVIESDGSVRGLDVFGGFMRDGHLYMMGEIRTPFSREWVFPLGTGRARGARVPGSRPLPSGSWRRRTDPPGARPTRRSTSRCPPPPTAGSTAGSAGCGSTGRSGSASTPCPSVVVADRPIWCVRWLGASLISAPSSTWAAGVAATSRSWRAGACGRGGWTSAGGRTPTASSVGYAT